ncbi:hypothetical protein PR202_ga20249 [Eleusine coracana subsp. coracana]|uniref:AIG1-type G domain-containing protein n=1 Tax=Eleusine coracana subsp. coracana TaxID=191504 RepID=A0AAV5CYJ7_ELECO|nr:hypothetical protein PR202_ga20249 [Eleusine coracana subsp. coracana]
MGGGGEDDGWVLHCPRPADVTLVLVEKVGTGKSATANSILGCDAFKSEYSYASVTETCQMWSTTLRDDGWLYDMNMSEEDVRKEIAKCMDMSKDGIHAMLMVFSAATRFTREDEDTINSIKVFFGEKILEHMILVFTHGDNVEESTWRNMLTNKGAREKEREMTDTRVVCKRSGSRHGVDGRRGCRGSRSVGSRHLHDENLVEGVGEVSGKR